MAERLDDAALDTLFRTARSYNAYTPAPVTDDDLNSIWELAKFGPTSANQMPARLVWCRSEEAKATLAACMSPRNAPKVLSAPVTVIIGMDSEFHVHLPELFPHMDARPMFAHNEALRRESAFRNSSLQGAYFILAARALGFDTGPMSGFDSAKVDAAFFADTPNITTNFICTLGHGDPATVFGRLPRPEFSRFNRLA